MLGTNKEKEKINKEGLLPSHEWDEDMWEIIQ